MSEAPNPAAATPNAGAGNPAPQPAQAAAPPQPAQAGQSPNDPNNSTPPPKAAVPEKYDFKLPDGAQLKPAQLEKIAHYAKEQGFSQEQAQKYLERENAVLGDFVREQQDGLKAQTEAWLQEVKNDKELGGEKFQENVDHATRAFDRFATPEFAKMMKETGLGNHPEMLRTFFKISQSMKDDQLLIPSTNNGQAKSGAELLYGGTKPS